MITSKNGIALIQSFEKCKLTAYQDSAGVYTIGFGNTFYEDGKSVKKGDVITKDRADKLFAIILSKFELKVTNYLKVQVVQNVFDAMVSFAYNCGGSYYDKKSQRYVPFAVWGLINSGQPLKTIADKLRVTAITAGGKKLNGLIRRRASEAQLLQNGKLVLG